MTWTEPTECRLCGHTDRRDLRYGLVHWLEADPGMAYEHIARCVNRDECRARVERTGDEWPVRESAA